MNYHSSTQTFSVDRAIASVLVAGVTFILGYTVVRASLAHRNPATVSAESSNAEVVIPHEGALWADFSTKF